MSDKHREIALRLGTQASLVVDHYLDRVIESVRSTDKPISFGVTFTFKPTKGLIHGSVRTRAPKIPVADMDSVDFTLHLESGAEQLELVFDGSPKEMLLARAAGKESEPAPKRNPRRGDDLPTELPDDPDGYDPSVNAVEAE